VAALRKIILQTASILLLVSSSLLAGENFKTFIKECGMGDVDINSVNNFPWSYPLDSLVANGVNYARLDMDFNPGILNTPPESWRDEDHILKMAALVKAAGLKLELVITYSDQGGVPVPWDSVYHLATDNNPSFNVNESTVPLEDSVYNYTYRVLSDFKDQGVPVDMITIGNEIGYGFLSFTIPTATPLYYQLLYEGCKAAKDVDSTIGVVIHFRNTGTDQLTFCENLAYAKERFGIAHEIPFDAFGFSFLEFQASLYDPHVPSSGPIALKQFLSNPEFMQMSKPLFVQETGFAWTFDPETFNGKTWGLSYTSPSDFEQTGYAFTPSGYRRYLFDEMKIIADSSNGLGVGTCVWAADNVAGWGRHPGMYNFALWDSKTGKLIAGKDGTTTLSVFKNQPPFDKPQLSVPSVSYPPNGDTLHEATLGWQRVVGAASYDIEISSDSIFSAVIVDSTGIADTLMDLTKLLSEGLRYPSPPNTLRLNTKYFWRVETDDAGLYSQPSWFVTPSQLTGVLKGDNETPRTILLGQNYPNPFNPTTTIRYQLSDSHDVLLRVYDALGREVATLVDRRQSAGEYAAVFDGSTLASGIYFYRLAAGEFISEKKMVLLK